MHAARTRIILQALLLMGLALALSIGAAWSPIKTPIAIALCVVGWIMVIAGVVVRRYPSPQTVVEVSAERSLARRNAVLSALLVLLSITIVAEISIPSYTLIAAVILLTLGVGLGIETAWRLITMRRRLAA